MDNDATRTGNNSTRDKPHTRSVRTHSNHTSACPSLPKNRINSAPQQHERKRQQTRNGTNNAENDATHTDSNSTHDAQRSQHLFKIRSFGAPAAERKGKGDRRRHARANNTRSKHRPPTTTQPPTNTHDLTERRERKHRQCKTRTTSPRRAGECHRGEAAVTRKRLAITDRMCQGSRRAKPPNHEGPTRGWHSTPGEGPTAWGQKQHGMDKTSESTATSRGRNHRGEASQIT